MRIVTLRTDIGVTAIILSGGLGSRLGLLAAELPKPMLPVGGRPFVEYLVIRLARSGFTEIVFATGHHSEAISRHFGDGSRWGVSTLYSHESSPLGTAGAIKLAAAATRADPLLILNGDSYLDLDPRMVLDGLRKNVAMTMALARVADGRRFGRVDQTPDGLVARFVQGEDRTGPATINAGVYGVRRQALDAIPDGGAMSLERQVLPSLAGHGLLGIASNGYFVDIGIPDAYLALLANPEPLLIAVGVGAVG